MKKYKIFIDKNTYENSEYELIKIPFDKFGMDKNRLYFVEDKPFISEILPLSINDNDFNKD